MPYTKTATTVNPAANNAKAASSSLTKYNCAATTDTRNHHIHLRLLASVLVIGLVSVPLGRTYLLTVLLLLLCGPLSLLIEPLAPEPFDTLGQPKSMVHKTHF